MEILKQETQDLVLYNNETIKYEIKTFGANQNQVKAALDIKAEWEIPIDVAISLPDKRDEGLKVTLSYWNRDELMAQWFLNEVLRREATMNNYLKK